MQKRLAASLLAGLVALAVVAGCGGGAPKETKWDGSAKASAVYATQIPLYPGAKFENAMGSDTYADLAMSAEGHEEGMSFWFEVSATQAELDAWYAERLTGYSKTDEDGTITYTLTPAGAESGEEMGVYLEDNLLRVWESTKPGKHKD